MIVFLLFSGSDYYPEGGWLDFRGCFTTIDEAKAALDWSKTPIGIEEFGWAHIVTNDKVIWFKNRDAPWMEAENK